MNKKTLILSGVLLLLSLSVNAQESAVFNKFTINDMEGNVKNAFHDAEAIFVWNYNKEKDIIFCGKSFVSEVFRTVDYYETPNEVGGTVKAFKVERYSDGAGAIIKIHSAKIKINSALDEVIIITLVYDGAKESWYFSILL